MKNTKYVLGLKTIRQEKALGIIFKQRQREIVKKVLQMETLTTIENQVYSRKIKPRLNAIIDIYEIAIIARSKE